MSEQTDSPYQRIAFLGLGHMGGPMIQNLQAAGLPVVGYDPVEAAVTAARAAGISVADSAVEAATGADVVITMLPAGQYVLDVYAEVLPVAAPGALFIDCSTISVSDAQQVAASAVTAGHRALDAPVSGGIGGATAGTLTFMVGGAEQDVAAAAAVLAPMAGRVAHCGGSGLGQAAKVCNNMILAIHMIGISEAFVLGEQLGLSPQALFDVASVSSGQCWSLNTYCPVPGPVPTSPANNDYQPGFATALMMKDLGLAMDAVHETGTAASMGELAASIYQQFGEGGGAGRDFSAIITDIRQRTKGDS